MRRLMRAIRRLESNAQGFVEVEFALTVGMLALLLVATIEFGNLLSIKLRLEGAVAAAANFALKNASNVNSTGGAALAASTAIILRDSVSSQWADADVLVNNGPGVNLSSQHGAVTRGVAANANKCYCPTRSSSSLTWGNALPCGSTCSVRGYAGKFVILSGSRLYQPLFSSFGVIESGRIEATATVQTE